MTTVLVIFEDLIAAVSSSLVKISTRSLLMVMLNSSRFGTDAVHMSIFVPCFFIAYPCIDNKLSSIISTLGGIIFSISALFIAGISSPIDTEF